MSLKSPRSYHLHEEKSQVKGKVKCNRMSCKNIKLRQKEVQSIATEYNEMKISLGEVKPSLKEGKAEVLLHILK